MKEARSKTIKEKRRSLVAKPYSRIRRRKSIIPNTMPDKEISDPDTDLENELLKSQSDGSQKSFGSMESNNEMMNLLRQIQRDQCTKSDFQEHSKVINAKFDNIDKQLSSHSDQIAKFNDRLDDFESKAAYTQQSVELISKNYCATISALLGSKRRPANDDEDTLLNMQKAKK